MPWSNLKLHKTEHKLLSCENEGLGTRQMQTNMEDKSDLIAAKTRTQVTLFSRNSTMVTAQLLLLIAARDVTLFSV